MTTILTDGNPILRKKAEEITAFNKELEGIVDDLEDAFYHCIGWGLAAPQIGISKRIVIVRLTTEKKYRETYFLVNPQIKKTSLIYDVFPEACLSLPGKIRLIPRSRKIEVHYQGRDGEHCSIAAKGPNARIIKHEIDHLDGILITDYRFMIKWHRNMPSEKAENPIYA